MSSALEQYGDLALFFLRIGVGVIFVAEGWQKMMDMEGTQAFFADIGIPSAILMAWTVGIIEFIGGLMVLLGLYIRLPSLLLAMIMIVAIFTVQLDQGFGAMQLELLLMFMCLSLFILGSGRLSFEHLFQR